MVALHSALSKSSVSCTLAPAMPVFPDLPLWAYPVLFATGLVAGTVDAIAGGGGLITLPARQLSCAGASTGLKSIGTFLRVLMFGETARAVVRLSASQVGFWSSGRLGS